MKSSRFLASLVAALLVAALVSPHASAVPITYSFSGVAQGGLNGSGFGYLPFEFDFTGDTANVVSTTNVFGNVQVLTQFSSQTVTVGNLGTFTLSDPMQVFNWQGVPSVGFGDLNDPGVFLALGAMPPSLNAYDLRSSFGPVSGDTFANDSQVIGLEGQGTLHMYAFTTNTFQATASDVPDTMPTLVLIGIGMVALAATGPQKRRALAIRSTSV